MTVRSRSSLVKGHARNARQRERGATTRGARGGTVLTLQGNPEWRGETLADALGGTPPDWTLPGFGWDVGDSFRQAGLNIAQWTDYTAAVTYHDIGAVVYELLHVPWGVVDFDLHRYRERLFRLHSRMQAEGGFRTRACTNLIEALKP